MSALSCTKESKSRVGICTGGAEATQLPNEMGSTPCAANAQGAAINRNSTAKSAFPFMFTPRSVVVLCYYRSSERATAIGCVAAVAGAAAVDVRLLVL